MSHVCSTARARDLYLALAVASERTLIIVGECRPSMATPELVFRIVERLLAATADIHAQLKMLVVLTSVNVLRALHAEHLELQV